MTAKSALIITCSLFVCFAVLPAGNAFGQTIQSFDEYGVGPRDGGMGNAFTAVANDFSAVFYNPGGLSQIEGFHFTLGYKFLIPKVTMKISGYDEDRFTNYPETHWGLIGITTDLHVPKIINPKYTDPFSFGFAFALSEFLHSYSNYYDEHTPYFFRYQDRPVALLSLYLAMGIRLTDWFSIGAGLVVAPSATYIAARVYTDIYLPEGNSVARQGLVNRAYSVFKPVVGVMFRIPIAGMDDRLRIGMTWRDEVGVIDGKGEALNRNIVHLPGTDETMEPVPPMVVPVETLSGYTPMQALLGVSYQPLNGMLIATDTIWKRWSEWENYFFNTPGPRFRDTLQQRIGLEQRFLTEAEWLEYWALRGGWYYQPSPTPSQNNEWNILDNDKHVMTGGFGLRLDRILGIIKAPVNLDADFQLHYLLPETIENDDDRFPRLQTGGLVYTGSVAFEVAW